MDGQAKPKRQLTPEQLEKLKLAREKALAVRKQKSAKLQEIKTLEKTAKQKELDEKLEAIRKKIEGPTVAAESAPEPTASVEPPAKQKRAPKAKKDKAEVVKKVLEEDSSDSSESDDDDETDAIKTLYKRRYQQKYKNKYAAKTVNTLTRGMAAQSIKKKVDDELYRLASANLFG